MTEQELQTLSKFQFFVGFKPRELETLVDLAEEFTFDEGTTIIQEGNVEDCMYVLLEGSVAILRENDGIALPLMTMEPAAFFGEIALVDDGPRSATVRAKERCKVLRIDRSTVSVLAGVQPAAAIHFLVAIGRSLVRLLRTSNKKYSDLFLSLQVPASPEEKIGG